MLGSVPTDLVTFERSPRFGGRRSVSSARLVQLVDRHNVDLERNLASASR